ncbi:malto-oligosyltrehalose synthase [Croceicoccus sp. F390]|uniref:Malto-oligosyltrehalose synthase n=1 Tax=Croceicoccus esteveae TaxID=3075597 RepID=A0ABU2ZH41_9SPHN|nr:malto-oligosyltrehalose synthase [Croceicoccus sp. F390]MDT0575700.1 malto-oligosyltrehalose synthase [Croceicoccus sp. F390]
MNIRATYRLQFNGEFRFADAEALVPYLDRLGISHVYASPITQARSGSTHGYDVVDPTIINPELGAEEGLRSLVAALRSRGMGLIIDIVPNHMGVAGGENAWWNDVLKHGQGSRYAHFFDIDWRDKLLLPILADPLDEALESGAICLDVAGDQPALVVHGEHRLPLAPPSSRAVAEAVQAGDIAALKQVLAQQHYRLGWWRSADDALNWRRFFTVNELAGIRVEEPDVFEATHALYFRLWEQGLIDGVRVDHVDGLTDPAGYCRTLRRRFDQLSRPAQAPCGPAYIIVEKILGAGEGLPLDWGIDGTSGYDFMEEAALIMHDPAGDAPLAAMWSAFSGRDPDFEDEELRARQELLSWAFEGQLQRCVDAFVALARSAPETQGLTAGMLRRAICRLIWVFPVYRTYGIGQDAPVTDAAVRNRVAKAQQRFTPPGEGSVADVVLDWLGGTGPGEPALAADAVRQFQQLSAPVAAKAVEDTAFYRYGKLLSRTDVGSDVTQFASDAQAFHQSCLYRAEHFPQSMLATATHDHKRGEDARARLAVLSAIPDQWQRSVGELDRIGSAIARRMNKGLKDAVHGADRYMLYQMVFGAWPDGLAADDRTGLAHFAQRLSQWQQKALREAKLRSSWKRPDIAYEDACDSWIGQLFADAEAVAIIHALVDRTAGAALANMLLQTALRYTVPGVPDLYQGTELADFSMVDPDNRRTVDFTRRSALLEADDADPKLALIVRLLKWRRDHPALFSAGSYLPATVTGPKAANMLAFSRALQNVRLDCVMAFRCGAQLFGSARTVPEAQWWEDTKVQFARGSRISAREAFVGGPVYLRLWT